MIVNKHDAVKWTIESIREKYKNIIGYIDSQIERAAKDACFEVEIDLSSYVDTNSEVMKIVDYYLYFGFRIGYGHEYRIIIINWET